MYAVKDQFYKFDILKTIRDVLKTLILRDQIYSQLFNSMQVQLLKFF